LFFIAHKQWDLEDAQPSTLRFDVYECDEGIALIMERLGSSHKAATSHSRLLWPLNDGSFLNIFEDILTFEDPFNVWKTLVYGIR
jgi:hypothetical protein